MKAVGCSVSGPKRLRKAGQHSRFDQRPLPAASLASPVLEDEGSGVQCLGAQELRKAGQHPCLDQSPLPGASLASPVLKDEGGGVQCLGAKELRKAGQHPRLDLLLTRVKVVRGVAGDEGGQDARAAATNVQGLWQSVERVGGG